MFWFHGISTVIAYLMPDRYVWFHGISTVIAYLMPDRYMFGFMEYQPL